METKEAYQAIAVTVAAHTPIGTRYHVSPMANMEYFDAFAIHDGATELTLDQAAERLNAQDADIARLRGRLDAYEPVRGSASDRSLGGSNRIRSSMRRRQRTTTELTDACANCGGAHHVQQCGELRAALGRFDADSTIAWLREELDEAHQHIGALLAHVSERGENFDLNDVVAEAKAWLRREAK
jgi:hypothetical protein